MVFEEDGGFGGPIWSRSVETSKEEEVDCILEAAPLAVDTGSVEADGVNANHLGDFVEVLKESIRLKKEVLE